MNDSYVTYSGLQIHQDYQVQERDTSMTLILAELRGAIINQFCRDQDAFQSIQTIIDLGIPVHRVYAGLNDRTGEVLALYPHELTQPLKYVKKIDEHLLNNNYFYIPIK